MMISITPVQPENDVGFKSFREKVAYVGQEYFAGFRPDEVFMLIARGMERTEGGCEPVVVEMTYFGTLSSVEPLFWGEESGEVFVIGAQRHVMDRAGSGEVGEEIRLSAHDVRGVPLASAFAHPRHGRFVRVFEVMLGLEAIEDRCLSLSGYADGLPRKLFGACARLGWEPYSMRYREAREAFREQLFAALHASRFSVLRRASILEQIVELGFARDAGFVAVGGHWRKGSELIEDLQQDRRTTA